MIDKISSNFQVQQYNSNIKKPAVYLTPPQSSPIDKNMMKGLEMLGIYNMNLVKNKENFEHEPAKPILPIGTKMDEVNGEKVYKPNGDVDYIVFNDGNTETKYFPDEDKSELVGKIEVKDTYSGKLLKSQTNCSAEFYYIEEYPENEPDISYSTRYYDGKLESVSKKFKLPNGSTKYYEKNYDSVNPTYYVGMNDKHDNHLNVDLDAQNNVRGITTRQKAGNVTYRKNLDLNKGAIINVRESRDMTVPNFMEREVLNDPDVAPAQRFNKDEIETVAKQSQNADVYSFYGNGSLKEFKEKGLRVLFNEDGSQKITEYPDEKTEKNTYYHDDGSIMIEYKNGDIRKTLSVSSENKPESYDVMQGDKLLKSAGFTDEGYLRWAT